MSLSLVLNITLGIILAEIIKGLWNAEQHRRKLRPENERNHSVTALDRSTTFSELELKEEKSDWLDLWSSVPDWAREQARRFVEADQLRRRAEDSEMTFLWSFLWKAAPEETKEEFRSRWKESRVRRAPSA